MDVSARVGGASVSARAAGNGAAGMVCEGEAAERNGVAPRVEFELKMETAELMMDAGELMVERSWCVPEAGVLFEVLGAETVRVEALMVEAFGAEVVAAEALAGRAGVVVCCAVVAGALAPGAGGEYKPGEAAPAESTLSGAAHVMGEAGVSRDRALLMPAAATERLPSVAEREAGATLARSTAAVAPNMGVLVLVPASKSERVEPTRLYAGKPVVRLMVVLALASVLPSGEVTPSEPTSGTMLRVRGEDAFALSTELDTGGSEDAATSGGLVEEERERAALRCMDVGGVEPDACVPENAEGKRVASGGEVFAVTVAAPVGLAEFEGGRG